MKTWTFQDVLSLALSVDRLAQLIGHRFELDRGRLLSLGFSEGQVRQLLESYWSHRRG